MQWFIFALGAAVLTSFVSVIEKKVLFKEHAAEFSATLAILNFAITIPFFYLIDFSIEPFVWILIILAAFFASVGFLFVAKAVRHMEISAASPLLNFGPGFTAMVAVLLLGEILSPLNVIGILTLMIGSYVLEIDFKSHSMLTPLKKIYKSKYIHYIFIALGSYSFSAVSGKYALNFIDPISLVLLQQLFIAIIFLFILKLFYDGFHGIKHGIKKAGWWIILMASITVSYRILQAFAMKITFVSLVMPIKKLSTLFATVLGGEIFKEHGLYQKIIACVIMLIGAYLVVIG